MIDIQGKTPTDREAVAAGRVRLSPEAIRAVASGTLPKGDAISAARLAGIMAAKRTSELIPLCHPIGISYVDLGFEISEEQGEVAITAVARAHARTGVEMEALTAVSAAALTIYDMCKALDPGGEICDLHVVRKSGGKTGVWERKAGS